MDKIFNSIDGKSYDFNKDYRDVIIGGCSTQFTSVTDLVIENIIMRRMIPDRKPYLIFNNPSIVSVYWRLFRYINSGLTIKHGDGFIKILGFDFIERAKHDAVLGKLLSELDFEIFKEMNRVSITTNDCIDGYKELVKLNITPSSPILNSDCII